MSAAEMVERQAALFAAVVFVSSLAAFRGMPGSAAYCASKAFLHIFLEGLRVDLVRTGVRVTSIHPGYVKSEMTEKNKKPMPLLLEADDAAERMGKAIVARRLEFSYPWASSSVMRLIQAFPNPLFDRIVQKLG